MIRELRELFAAQLAVKRAQRRQAADPCPPHVYRDGWKFCVRCGQYPDERQAT